MAGLVPAIDVLLALKARNISAFTRVFDVLRPSMT